MGWGASPGGGRASPRGGAGQREEGGALAAREAGLLADPVPGGVGPMTVAMLLKNTVTAAALSKGIVIKS